jgi:hypothetical protein
MRRRGEVAWAWDKQKATTGYVSSNKSWKITATWFNTVRVPQKIARETPWTIPQKSTHTAHLAAMEDSKHNSLLGTGISNRTMPQILCASLSSFKAPRHSLSHRSVSLSLSEKKPWEAQPSHWPTRPRVFSIMWKPRKNYTPSFDVSWHDVFACWKPDGAVDSVRIPLVW